MHPVNPPMTRLHASRAKAVAQKRKAAESSALQTHHAQAMAAYITSVFLSADLIGEGVEPSWTLGGAVVKEIDANKWTAFQVCFMDNWDAFVQQYAFDQFWVNNYPAFHAYDYGANVEIEVTERIVSLPQELSHRLADDTDDSNDSDGSEAYVDANGTASERESGADRLDPNTTDEPTPNLYSGGLQSLLNELEARYHLEHIASISYALAVNLHCLDAASSDPDLRRPFCMLADRNKLAQEYGKPRDLTFFPLAFHPVYGNFSSPKPPAFLDPVLSILRDNMSYHNQGADVLTCGFFQGYSNVKRAIRHGPDDLLAAKGMATGALTLPRSEAQRSAWIAKKQRRLLDQIEGKRSEECPDASKPFARERRRVEDTIAVEEVAFRMEQIISLNASALVPAQRSFGTILQPIFQLMRFYLNEAEKYTHILRCFRPEIFPAVLCSFSKVFELALGEMHRRYKAEGSLGLQMGLAEGVAALDRMGHYCFTGAAKALMPSVMESLGTTESLRVCGWPYITPEIIDLRQLDGAINLVKWPMDKQGRPRCMHIAALAHYYGPEVAASRQALLGFKELGVQAIRGLSSAVRFLDDLFQTLWIPQMTSYVRHQLARSTGPASRDDMNNVSGTLQSLEEDRTILQAWVESPDPFLWSNYEKVFGLIRSRASNIMSSQTRRDFAEDLYQSCMRQQTHPCQSYSSRHATWSAVLQTVLTHTSTQFVTPEQWQGALATAMLSNKIECTPGTSQGRITVKKVIRLVGSTLTINSLSARPGSLKRAALEATQAEDLKKIKRNQRISFGSSIPFRSIPKLVEQGFEKLDRLFQDKKSDQGIREHYQLARIVLQSCLGDACCDLMLMIVLTLASSSVTPAVPPNTRAFEAAKKRKDTASFAANLVTRMLCFLCRDKFPWETDIGTVLRVSEMTKKIEHKGVGNRLLRQVGWVQQIRGNRDSPRNDELDLSSRADLRTLRRELLILMDSSPAGFIAKVFRSPDPVWVERCTTIISDDANHVPYYG